MRLMMQSLLAERFKLAVHLETQVVPVLAMVLVKQGKTGPKLRLHSEGYRVNPLFQTAYRLDRTTSIWKPVTSPRGWYLYGADGTNLVYARWQDSVMHMA
jgi:uncharacterized protein (TIGR03435 family)